MKSILNKSSLLKRLFHRHRCVKIGFRQKSDVRMRYSMRHYKCQECGKKIWVDGRNDPYDN